MTLITENDFYVTPIYDQYYSNGIFVKYSTTKELPKGQKRGYSVQVAHLTYNTYYDTYKTYRMDRPYAGLLYIEAGREGALGTSGRVAHTIQVGAMGPLSGARELQNGMHKAFGMPKAWDWRYQVRNSPIINWRTKLYLEPWVTTSKRLAIYTGLAADLGTTFTQLTGQIGLRYGLLRLKPLDASIFGGEINLSSSPRSRELFIYAHTHSSLVGYDATIQGGLIGASSPVTRAIRPLRYGVAIGAWYSTEKMAWKFSAHFLSKETYHLDNHPHQFGSIHWVVRI